MMNKKIIIIVLIIISACIAFYSGRGMLTPYVSFKSARVSQDFVQIYCIPDKTKKTVYTEKYFSFYAGDGKGDSMTIRYRGVKPVNFEHADSVVALGKFDTVENIFEAEKILVKCPSKYTKQD